MSNGSTTEKILLETRELTKRFGGIVALNRCSIRVKENTIVGLIGPNGAGKTTLINLISRFYKSDAGDIYFKGQKINNLSPHELVLRGMGRTFQITRVFRRLSVLDNLMVSGLSMYKNKDELKRGCIELLKFFALDKLKDELAGNLSGGQQKLLEMARVMIADPDFILLDEPFHGIHPALVGHICKNIRLMNKKGKTFFITSHDVPTIMDICERIMVLNAGTLIANGSAREIRQNEKVIEAYLGI